MPTTLRMPAEVEDRYKRLAMVGHENGGDYPFLVISMR
jgi:hypothetical protein